MEMTIAAEARKELKIRVTIRPYNDRRELGGGDQGDPELQDHEDVRDIGDEDIGWTSRGETGWECN